MGDNMLLEISATPEEAASIQARMMQGARFSGPGPMVRNGDTATPVVNPAVNGELDSADVWDVLVSSAARWGGVVSGISARPDGSMVSVRLNLLAAADTDALEVGVCEALGLRRDSVRWDRLTRAAAGPGSVCLRCGGVDEDHLKGCDAAQG